MKTLTLTCLFVLSVLSVPVASAHSNSTRGAQTLSVGISQNGSYLGTRGPVLGASNSLAVSQSEVWGNSPTGSFSFAGVFGSEGVIPRALTSTRRPTPRLDIFTASLHSTGGATTSIPPTGGASQLKQVTCSSQTANGCTSLIFATRRVGRPVNIYAPPSKLMPAPEPAAALLLGTGLLAAGTVLRRRHRPATRSAIHN